MKYSYRSDVQAILAGSPDGAEVCDDGGRTVAIVVRPEFIAAVRATRRHQWSYFKTRSKADLIASKEAEREVDRMLKALG